MSTRNTIAWCSIAAVLFAFIFFYQRHAHRPPAGPGRMLPELRAEAVTSVLVRPSGPLQLQIRADRTNGTWQLTQPQPYPAEPEKIQQLLKFLEKLSPAPYITGAELRTHANADEEFGFATPRATLVIQQGSYAPRLRVGALTNPGDQVFVQVEGDLGVYVVDSELLKYIPGSANDWRNTALLSLANLAVDQVAVTNNVKGDAGHGGLPTSSATFVLRRDRTNQLWRMIWPLDARANNPRIVASLQQLQEVRIRSFVSDDPQTDLEPLGLAPAELELGFSNGTNSLALLQFGRSPTNDLARVYARRVGQTGVFTVDKAFLLPWCAFLNDFRDPCLLDSTAQANAIDLVHGQEQSSVERQPDGAWRILPGNFPANPLLTGNLLSTLTNLPIVKFVNDVVNAADLPQYGLAAPLSRFILKANCPGTSGGLTNVPILDLAFGLGTTRNDRVFAKRSDESFVYAVSTTNFARLPTALWQLRERTLCHFSLEDVTAVRLSQGGKVCELVHKGPLSWGFAPGSQGIINDGAIEETIRGVIQVAALAWVARGEPSRATYGFNTNDYHLTLELKNGTKFDLEFGGEAPSGDAYALVTLEDQPWIFEFPWILYRDVSSYLPLSPHR